MVDSIIVLLQLAALGCALPSPSKQSRELEQFPLSGDVPQAFSAPIEYWNGVLNLINITIGTPPQQFNASLDFTGNFFFVPSINCEDYSFECERGWATRHLYNRSDSSTNTPHGARNEATFWETRYYGYLDYDTVRIAGIEIEHQIFEEFTRVHAASFLSIAQGYDGALGLAPPSNRQGYPNYLQVLQNEKVLNKNIVSIKLPAGIGKQGEIMFGDMNPKLYTGPLKTVKTLPNEEGYWILPISNIWFNTSVPLHATLRDYNVTIVSEPIIVLPSGLASLILSIIGAKPLNPLWATVPCETRPLLPALTFQLGDHNITITGMDYVFELEIPAGPSPACVVWFEPDDWYGKGYLYLGSTFLKGVYSVFDWGEGTVGFAELKR